MLEVGCGHFVLRILELINPASMNFACRSSACEKVAGSVFMVLEGDIGVEEQVDGGLLVPLKFLYCNISIRY